MNLIKLANKKSDKQEYLEMLESLKKNLPPDDKKNVEKLIKKFKDEYVTR